MNTLLHWLAEYGLAVAFVNVLLAQLGAPLPSYPVLIVTGALAFEGRFPVAALHATVVLASLIADLAWYGAGRRYGGRVVRTVCRISISPDTCVQRTQSLFDRWGAPSLMVAKFIPGFGVIATSLAGNVRLPLVRFIVFDAIGAALFTGVGIGLGMLFHDAVAEVLAALAEMGRIGLVLIVAAFALFIAVKWWQRHALIRELRMARISVDELVRLIEGGDDPVILDVRDESARRRDGTIPGALHWPLAQSELALPELPRDAQVVVFCACPNEISAARVAKRLQLAGFRRVRPLHGGIEAWIDAGRSVEPIGDARTAAAR
jgi:membrane protein DedA with SNARE-associated domain/rhodanese-related sulfurtransferase